MNDANFYAGGGLDRAGLRRKDAQWLAERLEHAATRFVPVWRGRNLVAAGGEPRAAFVARAAVAEFVGDPVLLGLIEDCAYFCVDLSTHEAPLGALAAAEGVE